MNNPIDRNQLLKMLLILFAIIGAVGIASYFRQKSAITLDQYAKERGEYSAGADNGSVQSATDPADAAVSGNTASDTDRVGAHTADTDVSGDVLADGTVSAGDAAGTLQPLTGAWLNGGADGQAMAASRVTYTDVSGKAQEAFYMEPLSEDLRRYMTGVSYPAAQDDTSLAITLDELRYLHILHYNFDGMVTEGELICNTAIALDLLDIFYELYRNEYQIEQVRLIDEYDGDDTASMEDNNTSCFNYRVVEGSDSLSKHALGLAIDVNPFYNPYITYDKTGKTHVSPEAAVTYADRSMDFAYKIDENDLCYKLFIRHGFIWGGNWNSVKDYQHFQKTP